MFKGETVSELRKDPISGKWVVIAPERMQRPNFLSATQGYEVDDSCPFCQGNEVYTEATIQQFPVDQTWQVRTIPNKFPALRVEGEIQRRGNGIYDYTSGIGAHEIIINTPKHNKELADLETSEIELILQMYQSRIIDLFNDIRMRYVLIYLNKGQEAGATIPHSHSQLIATTIIPELMKDELNHCRQYYFHKERCLICDIVHQEQKDDVRVVQENEQFIAIAPYASRVPFEIQIYPKKHSSDFATCNHEALKSLSGILKDTLSRLKNALNSPPYNLVLHTAPNTKALGIPGQWQTVQHDFHWHMEIVPRLTKSAGFEWGTGYYINPSTPEDCAAYLKELKI